MKKYKPTVSSPASFADTPLPTPDHHPHYQEISLPAYRGSVDGLQGILPPNNLQESVRQSTKYAGPPTSHSSRGFLMIMKKPKKVSSVALVYCFMTAVKNVVAGLSISAPIERRKEEWVKLVKDAGKTISERLGA